MQCQLREEEEQRVTWMWRRAAMWVQGSNHGELAAKKRAKVQMAAEVHEFFVVWSPVEERQQLV